MHIFSELWLLSCLRHLICCGPLDSHRVQYWHRRPDLCNHLQARFEYISGSELWAFYGGSRRKSFAGQSRNRQLREIPVRGRAGVCKSIGPREEDDRHFFVAKCQLCCPCFRWRTQAIIGRCIWICFTRQVNCSYGWKWSGQGEPSLWLLRVYILILLLLF